MNRILQRAAADRRTLSRPTKERPTKGRQKERHWLQASSQLRSRRCAGGGRWRGAEGLLGGCGGGG